MLRHRCAACGKPINRTDLFFEESDGTLCRACVLRLSALAPAQQHQQASTLNPCPPWAILPQLSHKPLN